MPERPGGSHQVLVAVAHGSADPRAAATVTDLMAVTAERAAARGLHLPEVRTAYLGHAAPSLPQVMGAIAAGQVTVLPLLLTAAYHSKTDIPRVLAGVAGEFPRLRVTYGTPLGPHPLLLSALERRLAEADPLGPAGSADPARRAQTGVVLAAAGSTDPEANAAIARLATRWQARSGWFEVRPASAAAATPASAGPGRGRDRAAARRGPPGAGRHLPACSRLVRRPDPRIRPGRGGGGGIARARRFARSRRGPPGPVRRGRDTRTESGVNLGKTPDRPRATRGPATR